VQYNIQNQKTIPDKRIRQHLIELGKTNWKLLTFLAFFSLLDIGIGLLQPWPMKIFIDSVVGTVPAPGPLATYSHQTVLLFIVVTITVGLFLLSIISGYIQMRVSGWLNFSIDKSVQTRLYEKILGLPPETFSEHTVGDYIYRQTSETKSVADFIIEVTLTIFESVVKLSGAIIILLLINWQLGLIALIPIPIIILSLAFFNPIIERQARALRETSSTLFSFTQESINLTKLIRIFDRIATQSTNLVKLLNVQYQTGLRQRKTTFFFNFANSTSTIIQSSVLLLVGGMLILNGQLTIGELLIFFGYVSYLTGPLHSIAGTINQIKTLKIHLAKVYEIVDSPDIGQKTFTRAALYTTAPRQTTQHAAQAPLIAFRNVDVYKDGNRILAGVSFDIYQNEKVGIIGPSGSGKSTLFDVILGFTPHQSGEIFINGQAVEHYNAQDLRKLFSVVSQESELLNMTIQENIAFGAPIDRDPTIDEITTAAENANATEFIIHLPDMFETKVGDAKVSLSGGQKQRISIARSLLRNAPILLLDEPTSALDRQSAKEVLGALHRLMANRTSLFITHDLSILDTMDRVYVVKDGMVKPVEAYGGLAGYERILSAPQRIIINKGLQGTNQ
jgi:ATP-binding cassette subfamily B protein